MGIIERYSCDCGYDSGKLYTGGGFNITRELRACATCESLVAVPTAARAYRGPRPAVELETCPRCGWTATGLPTRIRAGFLRRAVACSKCGRATRRTSAGIWD